ncbi:MAG: tetratricopeptide repeat protein [Patescibacteria group bacterium]|nr:tetratricopeptide repeat protein [Patescibacteria group bacterium]
MTTNEKQTVAYLQNGTQIAWGIVFLLFPLFFLTLTTDPFVLPKQILVAVAALLSLLVIGAEFIIQKKVLLRRGFLDLPVTLFMLALALSAVFSINRYDALTAFVPLLLLAITYFVLSNSIRSHQSISFFITALITSGAIVSLLTVFNFLKAYVLPFAFTHTPTFSPFGSLLDEGVYLLGLLPVAAYYAYPVIKGKVTTKTMLYSLATLVMAVGAALSFYQAFTAQKIVLLPFMSGFQIAFAAISQDAPRIAQGFFFGSGVGTFLTDFTRFKQVTFNADNNLWFLTFAQSSSYILELLATTGVLGLLAFIFVLGKTVSKPSHALHNPLFFSFLVLAIATFILPFSFSTIALFFFVLTLFGAVEGIEHTEKAFDLEFLLVTLRRNLFSGEGTPHTSASKGMPIALTLVFLVVTGVIGFYSVTYVLADMAFNDSLNAANQNNGSLTYQKQVEALTLFGYRDSMYRVFSQTNIQLANSILALSSSKGQQPSAQAQQTAISLIQQAITAGRSATTISPINTLNWQNLASVYRSLIGFGQNAENFAIASMQQAIVLDPTNPQEYLTLGGLYYQLGQYDNAIRQFQTAINLKPDYANAYYNLGHSFEQKGDLQTAVTDYQIVRQLVAADKNNASKIDAEIAAVQAKLGSNSQNAQAQQANFKAPATTGNQGQLNVAGQQQGQLPQVQQQVPLATPAPSK